MSSREGFPQRTALTALAEPSQGAVSAQPGAGTRAAKQFDIAANSSGLHAWTDITIVMRKKIVHLFFRFSLPLNNKVYNILMYYPYSLNGNNEVPRYNTITYVHNK